MSVAPESLSRQEFVLRASWADLLPLCIALAALADAWAPPVPALRLLWLDLAALAGVLWAACTPSARRSSAQWATPFDGRILSAVLLGGIEVLSDALGGRASEPGGAAIWLRQMLACGVFYYALSAQLRGTSRVSDRIWKAFAITSVCLGAHAIVSAIGGLGSLEAACRRVDAQWGAHHGLAKALAFAALLTAGRALERNASPAWRFAAVIGVVGTVLHAAAGGFGLEASALARLDEPLYFSATSVLLLLLAGLVRLAWQRRREMPEAKQRWRALTVAFLLLALMGVFGGTSGGEGVRVLAVLAAVAAIVSEAGTAGGGREAVPAPAAAPAAPVAPKRPADEAPAAHAA